MKIKKKVISVLSLSILCMLMAVFCPKISAVKAEGKESAEPVKLRFIFYGDLTSRSEEFFRKDFHDIVLDELNIDLSVEVLPWGSEDKLATMLASGERLACFSIIPGSTWPAKGYLAKLDEEMIRQLCPDYIKMRDKNGFECAKYEGDIYAIPFGNKPYGGRFQSFASRNDIIKSVGYNADDIKTYDELMEMLAAVHEKYPDMRIISKPVFLQNQLAPYLTDQVYTTGDGPKFAYVDSNEEGDKVYSNFESESFKNVCKVAAEWVELGYINMDELTNPTQGEAEWNAGNCLLYHGHPATNINTGLKNAVPGAEERRITLDGTTKLITQNFDWSVSISAADADHVEQWLTLFNWMYKNSDNYNLTVNGIEGTDWTRRDDGSIERLNTDTFFPGWFMEAIEYNTYDPSIPEEETKAYEHWDDDAVLAKDLGFSFDTSSVTSEIALMTAVYNEKLKPMQLGLLDFDENYELAIEELKDAGLDKYMEEYQRQFSEWYAKQQ